MAGPLSALGLGREKFCLGRWLAILAFAEEPEALPRTAPARAKRSALAGARRAVEAATATALEDQSGPAAEFLDRLVASVELGGPALGDSARALKAEVAAFKAAPADPFEEIFSVAHQVAVGFYGDAGQEVPEVRCGLCLDPGSEPPFPSFPAVDGHLETRDSGKIVAILKLTATQFWREEMCALTYATLHELVVHAFASPVGRNSTDSFAEGWMDFLAFDLHDRLCGGELPLNPAFAGALPPWEQHLQAEGSHIARSRTAVTGMGRASAKAAQDALVAAFGRDRGGRAMRAFSAALNCSDVPPDRRAEACEAIGRAVRHGGAAADHWIAAAEAVEQASSASEKREIAAKFACSPACNP